MKGRAHVGWVGVGLLVILIVAASTSVLVAQPTTYAGVTFPHGDVAFADRVVDYMAASCVRDAYDDPEEALGPPDACPNCQGCGGCSTNAVSLGFRLSEIDIRGYLVLEFVDNVLVDVPGDDLFVYITNDKLCRVEISVDGLHFIEVGEVVGYPAAIDIAAHAATGALYRFVRLTDVAADEDHSDCPGPSIDAVGAMGLVQEIFVGEAFGSLELQPVGELALVFEGQSNILLLLLDGSSSMAERIDGEQKIDIAKSVINDLIDNLPDEAQIGMRYFAGCENSPVISEIKPLDRDWLKGEVARIQPKGLTPIAYALEQAKTDLLRAVAGKKLVLLVSDGMETCRGKPVEVAQSLLAAGLDLRIHVVGFDIGEDVGAREQLIAIAQSTGGVYFDASNREELRQALTLSAPFSYTVFDEAGVEVYAGRLGDDGPRLPTGNYRVVIDSTPQIVLAQVLISDGQITMVTVERTNGGYHADVGS
jgi:hypothetical protein